MIKISRFLIILMLIVTIQKNQLLAGPPFMTDDPVPVDVHHWEIYIASQDIFISNAGSGTLPHFEVNYGAFTNTQLHLIVPLAFSYLNNEKTSFGISDFELGIKYRFIHESVNFPQIGTFPLIEIPTGDVSKKLGNGRLQIYLPVWLQKSFGSWQSYGGAGYWLNSAPGNKNWIYAGWLLQNDLSETLTIGCELYYHTKQIDTSKNTWGFNLGAYINPDKINHILFSLGRTLFGDNNLTAYLGYQWTF